MYTIDLNCDIGEGYGAYRMGQDQELMKSITSANIACGFHAGDPATIRESVRLAKLHGVAIGAHPGLPDLTGFGRRWMAITPQEAYDMMVYQIGAVQAFAQAEGSKLDHVKPHGALYNQAATNEKLADAIAEAIYQVDGELKLYGLAGSRLIQAGDKLGLKTVSEVFADRSYESDGSLTARHIEGAVLTDVQQVAAQALLMIKQGTVMTRQGTELQLQAETLCVHGDTPNALQHVIALREALMSEGIQVKVPNR